jgi:hypothetical protein
MKVTCDPNTALSQTHRTIEGYATTAKEICIDLNLDPNQVVPSLVQAMAIDFATTSISWSLQNLSKGEES